MGNISLIQWLAFERLSNVNRRTPTAIHPESSSAVGHAGFVSAAHAEKNHFFNPELPIGGYFY
jgi:hypothetical protein